MNFLHRGIPAGMLRRMLFVLIATSFGLASYSVAQTSSGGTLTIGAATEPPNLDPQRDAGGPSSEIQENIFETLVAFNEDMELVPHLAESWEVSEDGTVYTFTLREGITFHDGTPLTAEAVRFTFDRALGKVDERTSRYATLMTQLESVQVIDEHTLEFHLANPFAPFINNLAHLGHAILSPTAVEERGEEFGRAPVGTGPFRLATWRTGQEIVLERNPDYWQADLPKLDRVVFRYIPDASTRLVTLESGEIDVALSIPESDFAWLSQSDQFRTYQADTLRTVFLMFNPTMAPFDDLAVRQAVTAAIDRESIASAILENLHRPALRPTLAPGVWGVSSTITPYEFNVERAAQILEDAGWTVGPDGVRVKDGQRLAFTLYTTQGRYPKDGEIGAYLRGVFSEALNAEVDLGTFEWETYRNSIFSKDLGLFLFGAGVSTGDIDYVTTILFHSDSQYSQIPTSVEDEIIEAQTTTDPDERLAQYEHIQETIAQEYLWVPLYWQSELHASLPTVENFEPHPLEKVRLAEVEVR